jgi:hypothetical protein
MWVRITRRLAERVNDVDLSRHRVGDTVDLVRRDAELLIAEGWATPIVVERRSGSERRRVTSEKPARSRSGA